MRTILTSLILSVLLYSHIYAQGIPTEEKMKIGILSGLLQPIAVKGGNLQFEATLGRFVFDYSHGWSLDPPSTGDLKDQQLSLHLPYSTGLGVGYRITDALDLRLEPKLHKFEVRYDGGPQVGRQVVSYRTITLGLGAYYKWHPFRRSSGPAKGITIAPSFRWWPNAWSSLDADRHTYESAITGQQEIHKAADIGIANTSFIINISMGYEFAL